MRRDGAGRPPRGVATIRPGARRAHRSTPPYARSGTTPGRGGDQKASALTTSPPALVPRAHQILMLMVLLTNFTLPSHIPTFTPPGWLLVALYHPLCNTPQLGQSSRH